MVRLDTNTEIPLKTHVLARKTVVFSVKFAIFETSAIRINGDQDHRAQPSTNQYPSAPETFLGLWIVQTTALFTDGTLLYSPLPTPPKI